MCVLYASVNEDKKNLKIKYGIENLAYVLPEKQIRVNLSFFLTNDSERTRSIRIVHRKSVDEIKTLNTGNKLDYDFLQFLCNVYSGRLSFNLEEHTVDFYCKPKEFAKAADHLENIVFEQNLPFQIEDPAGEKMSDIEKWKIPYTSIRIDNFPAGKTVFYSLNMVVKDESFDYILGGTEIPTINGPVTLLKKIKDTDLLDIENDSPCHSFFESHINRDDRILKPERYDVIIQNKRGTLPECYRLNPNVHRENIRNSKLESNVAWFSSDDPNQDFVIEVFFSDRDNEILRKYSEEFASLVCGQKS